MRGAFGSWRAALSDFSIASVSGSETADPALNLTPGNSRGHIGGNFYFSAANRTASYLHRFPVPGFPEANRLNASLDMRGNPVRNAGDIEVNDITLPTGRISQGEASFMQTMTTLLRQICTEGQILVKLNGAMTCADTTPNINLGIFTQENHICFVGNRNGDPPDVRSVSVSCPTDSRLISCDGSSGDSLEQKEGYLIQPDFMNSRCTLQIQNGDCQNSNDPLERQTVIAYCRRRTM